MTFPFIPKIVGWELTRRCNFSCIHCGTSCGAPRDDELTLEQAYRMIEDLGTLKCEIFNMSGGEPLMHPHWFELAQRAEKNGMKVFMITNGWYVEENIDKIAASPIGRVGISIDGDEEIHNYIRKNPQAYKRALGAIRALKSRGIAAGAVTHVSKQNFHMFEDMYKVFSEIPLDFWQIQLTFASGRMKEHADSILEPEAMIDVARFVEDKRTNGEMRVCVGDNLGYHSRFDIADSTWKGCFAGRWLMGIEADGSVKGCLSLPPDFYEDNVKNRSIIDIWQDRELFKMNRYFNPEDMKGTCKDCDKIPECRGGCKVTAFCASGSIYENPFCLYRVEKEAEARGEKL